MTLVLDIWRVAVYAELGEPGKTLLDLIREAAEEAANPGFKFDTRYEALDAEAYVFGAAQLALDEFWWR